MGTHWRRSQLLRGHKLQGNHGCVANNTAEDNSSSVDKTCSELMTTQRTHTADHSCSVDTNCNEIMARPPPLLLWVGTKLARPVPCRGFGPGRQPQTPPWVGNKPAPHVHCPGLVPGPPAPVNAVLAQSPLAPVKALGWHQAHLNRSLP